MLPLVTFQVVIILLLMTLEYLTMTLMTCITPTWHETQNPLCTLVYAITVRSLYGVVVIINNYEI